MCSSVTSFFYPLNITFVRFIHVDTGGFISFSLTSFSYKWHFKRLGQLMLCRCYINNRCCTIYLTPWHSFDRKIVHSENLFNMKALL